MRKGFITILLVLVGMTGVMAQNSLTVGGPGQMVIHQGELKFDDKIVSRLGDLLSTSTTENAEVTLPELNMLKVSGSGDVIGIGTFKGKNLKITSAGSGDIQLTLDYDTVNVTLTGKGNVVLKGHCQCLQGFVTGTGDIETSALKADKVSVAQAREYDDMDWSRNAREKRSLLMDPHWNGVEAGLNILMGTGSNGAFTGEYALLEQRTMKSWEFNFNLVDIGLAFSKKHVAGIFTGFGLSWNNFSFDAPVRLVKGDTRLECHVVESTEGTVTNSKLGILYLQAPLMIEIRPTKRTFVAFGVTGGVRVNSWTKINFKKASNEKVHSDYYLNRFKLDASLRGGSNILGFFANYSILPLFLDSTAPTSRVLSFGVSVNF